jgi:hypothetical protein
MLILIYTLLLCQILFVYIICMQILGVDFWICCWCAMWLWFSYFFHGVKPDTWFFCDPFYFRLLRIYSVLQMLSSLKKIMSLSDDTSIYCGHEYTLVSFLIPSFMFSCFIFYVWTLFSLDFRSLKFGRIIQSLHCP